MRGGLTFAAATPHTLSSPTRPGLRGPPVANVCGAMHLQET